MSSRKPGPGTGGRWSDGETSALIDTWAPLHLRRDRGSLSAKDWRLVASAVNAHLAAAGRRFNRSRVQCQKRVYTLKDQYNKELSKQAPSRWRHFSQLRAFLASPTDPPPGFPAKTPASATVKKEDETEEEVIGGVSGLAGRRTVPTRRHFSSLRAILASLHGPPPGFPPAMMPASVKEEEEEEVVGGGCGLVGSGAAGGCPASVVTKLADVYERVEMARLNVEKEKMDLEKEKMACWKSLGAVEVENKDEANDN